MQLYPNFKKLLDIGDIIGVKGSVFVTKVGETGFTTPLTIKRNKGKRGRKETYY